MKKLISIVALLVACPTEGSEAPKVEDVPKADEKTDEKIDTVKEAEKKADEKAAEKKDEKKTDG